MLNELEIPNSVKECDKALELARIWIGDGNQHFTLTHNLWDDPGAWGILLIDLARHVAKAYAEKGYDRGEVLAKVLEAMNAELSNATDQI